MIATLLVLFAAQETETVPKGQVHREAYALALEEVQKAQQSADNDPKGALDVIERVFNNPKISTKDRRLAFTGPGGTVLRTVDFFPHQARGRIQLYLAGQAKTDPQAASKLLAAAITDLKASVDAGVKSSEKLLAVAEESQKKLKMVKPPDPPRESPKETAAEQSFREAWFKMIEDHRYKSARDSIDSKGGVLSPEKRRDFSLQTDEHCRKFVLEAQEEFVKAMENHPKPADLRGMNALDFARKFSVPAESEMVGTWPALEWSRKERAAFERLRQTEAHARLEEATPVLELLLAQMVGTEPLERSGENRWFKASNITGYRYLEEMIRGLIASAREGSPEARRAARDAAEKLRGRWSVSIAKLPRDFMTRNGVHDHSKPIALLMEEFPVDPSDLDKMDVDACFTADSPDVALEGMISSLTRLRDQQGARLSKDASRKLLTDLVAATALRDLLAGKSVDDEIKTLGELGRSLAQAGGPLDPARWGPKIERIFASLQ
jgi:hypothetical protein